MKNTVKKILSILIIITIIFSFGMVYANDNSGLMVTEGEYSEAYKKWLELDEEERKTTVQPRKYDVTTNTDNSSYLKNMDNVFKAQTLVRASIPTKYDLRDVIPENVAIRNQMSTNSCWAFATLGVLESSLGLSDKNASASTVTYDFSERHMNYASTRAAFLNNQINEYGFSRELGDGGNFWMASAYLTNGFGAVEESDLPFEDNEDDIDISEIQNKQVKTTLYDTKEFESVTPEERNQVMQSMKEHIMNYGGIYANIHGADFNNGDNYNNDTGALYCKNPETDSIDHAITIIGWDDNYSRDNFNENQKPEEDGAWIVKNSWGEYLTEKLINFKQAIFEQNEDQCIENGWLTPEQIPNSEVEFNLDRIYGEDRYKIEGEDVLIEIGDNGYMYMSYEDCNIYTNMAGIEKVTYSKDYDNVYQNDLLGFQKIVKITSPGTVSLANVFKRDSSIQEELSKISIFSNKAYEYKVYVNPNGDSKDPNDLVEMELKEGDTKTVDAGYHVLEFAEPIRITGDSFVVVVQIVNAEDEKSFAIESKVAGTAWEDAVVNEGESFFATEQGFETNTWDDVATWQSDEGLRGNLCIKAYTDEVEGTQEVQLSDIYIAQEPTKTVYQEGESFDTTGMKIIARYSDGSSKEITNYEVIGGNNLAEGTTSVTISYSENGVTKTTTQEITVSKEEVEAVLSEIYIEQSPNKIAYQEGENFDTTGMKVIARYSDGSSKEITNYEVIGGNNLTEGTTSVTISYSENGVTKTTTQKITVNQEEQEVVLSEIYIDKEPTKTAYQEGENFDKTGMRVIAKYSDGSSKEITDYEIIDGENLKANTTSITIRYTENGVIRSTNQKITVNEKEPEPEPSKDPVPSDFTNSKAEITDTKLYFYSSDLSNLTGEITIKVTGIKLGDESNTYEHYCYLSGTQGDENINDWKKTELKKESDGTYSITWTVKPEELSNYEEMIESDNLYLYIRETASVDGNSVENIVTLEVDNQSDPQCYIDGKYVGGIDDVLNYNNGNNGNNNNGNSNNGDNTIASGRLPYAGRTILIIAVVLAIGVSGVFAYHRYKHIDR